MTQTAVFPELGLSLVEYRAVCSCGWAVGPTKDLPYFIGNKLQHELMHFSEQTPAVRWTMDVDGQ